MHNNLSEFIEDVLARFTSEITDKVFLMIEEDGKLMEDYLRWVSKEGVDHVNQSFGKRVKTYFDLENLEENDHPKSKLIKSYTQHNRP